MYGTPEVYQRYTCFDLSMMVILDLSDYESFLKYVPDVDDEDR
jgi:hypothetical protein